MLPYVREQVRQVRQLIADDNMGELSAHLVKLAGALDNRWDGDAAELLDVVRALPEGSRRRLAKSWADRYEHGGDGPIVRSHIATLAAVVSRDLPDNLVMSLARIKRLQEYAEMHSTWSSAELSCLVRAELDAGRAVPDAVIATMRRSAPQGYPDRELNRILGELEGPVLNPGEAWSDQALSDLADAGERWHALVRHAAGATSAQPSAKWEKAARQRLDRLPLDEVRTRITSWLALVGRPRTQLFTDDQYRPHNEEFDPYNADALRGLAWTLSLLPGDRDTARALGRVAETALRKVPGLGPRNPKVANACVVALTRSEGGAALAELARLATRVTYKGTLKIINSGLDQRAKALGLTREEIEELAVPAYGLTEVGRSEHRLGDCAAELTITGSKTTLTWRNATGKAVKAPPAQVKRDHPDELKELKAAAKDIDKMLGAQAERLDRQFLARRVWPYEKWRTHYLDHPLVGTLARRLLWTVDGQAVGYADGELRTLTDEPMHPGPDAEVRLWHPIHHEPAQIVAWRDWLERHAITQPFKQAHREVYLLTDAERTTGTYSNRFAAHILRQHQFHALAAVRGWRNKLRLCVDDEAPPAVRELPQWGLRAEYWIEGVGDNYGVDTTESGSYLRLGTDQVRFYPLDAPENSAHCYGGEYRMWLRGGQDPVDPLPLTDIPPLALSEVLRDVDLFVGVASVGNDPTWQDGGPEGRFQEYWTSYGFGELGASAETRRALLTRLIPRLAIADRCTLEGRFLHVKGELHTYKIHLGSGNILRTPNDQYLCIVPKGTSGAADPGGYLPFEGDRVLSVILSKAMLLAKDTEITDPTITSQL
ncbi:DUF4132 domain-containing protein [Streptomyces sp. N35]|uniref:DUF4132 domain-containing protein n=1 Tax=Streptomyces sp. N35 TaxID=2795730 RepID=UPI001F280BA2|nr:DUF4132 domain-containing protein [Streptomyces sp. N35]